MFCWTGKLIVTVGGLGLLPFGRGTFGTFGGLLLFVTLRHYGPADPWLVPLAGCLVTSVVTVLLGSWCERHFGVKDPPPVVLDEVAGIFLTFAGVRFSGAFIAAAGFVLFRLFDIAKPFPCKQAQKLPAGWGIVVDDLAAAVYANLLLRLGILLA